MSMSFKASLSREARTLIIAAFDYSSQAKEGSNHLFL